MVHAGTNMRVHALSRTDGHIEDEYVSYVQSFYFLLTDAILWTKRDILLIHHQLPPCPKGSSMGRGHYVENMYIIILYIYILKKKICLPRVIV